MKKYRLKFSKQMLAASIFMTASLLPTSFANADSDPQGWTANVPTPHLTPQTRFLVKNVNYDLLPVVSEGIFYIQEYNRSIGYASYYGFWTIDGRCLFPAIYEGFTSEQPRFDSGACVVKATGTKRHSPVILYADGKTKSLSHEWEAMTQFYDGVAMVREIVEHRYTNLFYINTKGEKIWPHLANNRTTAGISIQMRYLREGLRAYYSNPDKKWGFLNPDGSVAISPRYKEVRDFHNGYALVIVKRQGGGEKAVYIDKKGNEVVEVPENIPSLMYASNVSDISNGYFCINGNYEPTRFFNLKGEEVKTEPNASGFADGYAFVLNEQYGSEIYTVDTNFKVVNKWPFTTDNFKGYDITFNRVPYYTYDNFVTLNTAGEPVMYVPKSFFSADRLGQFSEDGYASACSEFKLSPESDKAYTYSGYIDTEGAYKIVFVSSAEAGGPFDGRIPGPQPIEPWEPVLGGLPPVDTIPVGPIGGGERTVRYHVSVKASPAEGGEVFGSGDYAYGDTIRVTGRPAEGYRISYIESSRRSSATKTFNKFVVKGDMEITCYFTKKDETEDMGKGTMLGAIPEAGIPVYLQLGAGGDNRFPEPSQGFLAVLMDDSKALASRNTEDKISMSINIFFVPMNVIGMEEEGGRRYMVIDGGIMKYSNFGVSDDSSAGMLNNPLLSMMMAFDGAGNGELQPGRYRVEILEGSPEKGEMRLGMIQRFSPKYGWINADDPSFHLPLGGFFIRRVDKGLGSSFLNGVVLKSSAHRDINWEPSSEFYGGNQSMMENFAAALGQMFRKKTSGTPLSDYDMQQFSTDIDNHLFKMK